MYSSIILLTGMETKIFISEQIPESLGGILGQYGKIIKLPPFSKLQEPIASHADILIFKEKNKLFVPREYHQQNSSLFFGIEVECIDEELGREYPNDIYLDALAVGDNLICKEKYTSKKIKQGKRIIDVKQGYARCSVCLLNNGAAITADQKIGKCLGELGTEVLMLESGSIVLLGYSYGFIGGACTVINNRVIFFGNIEEHPQGKAILDFVSRHGFKAEYPKDFPVTDFGSAIII